jgi:heme A synthase
MNQFKESEMGATAPAPPRHHRRMQRIGAFALLLAMAVVLVASAWLRLNAPRAGCASWPLCRFEQRAQPAAAAVHAASGAVRAVHRVAASGALLLIVALSWQARRRRERNALRLLGVLLALALALSALGIATPGSRAAAVMLGNLLGGAAMFALAWALWRGLDGAAALPRRLQRAALGVALLWIAQAALGALSGSAASGVATLSHLLLALLLAIAAFGLALALRRAQHRRESNALLALLGLQLALGAGAAFGGAASGLVLAHNAGAALGLALLLGWVAGPRAGSTGA